MTLGKAEEQEESLYATTSVKKSMFILTRSIISAQYFYFISKNQILT